MRHNSSVLFFFQYFICFGQNKPIRVQIFRTDQIPYVIFQTNSQFLFKYCITLQCHDTLLLNFFSSIIIDFPQREPIKVSAEISFFKFLMSLFKEEVSSSSNFTSFFRVMTHNYSLLFCPKHIVFSTKAAHQSANFQTCHCSH